MVLYSCYCWQMFSIFQPFNCYGISTMWLEEFVSVTRFLTKRNPFQTNHESLKLKPKHLKPNLYGGFIFFKCFCCTYPTWFNRNNWGQLPWFFPQDCRWCPPMESRFFATKNRAHHGLPEKWIFWIFYHSETLELWFGLPWQKFCSGYTSTGEKSGFRNPNLPQLWLMYPLVSTNIAGWKIHHEWSVDVFPMGKGGCSAQVWSKKTQPFQPLNHISVLRFSRKIILTEIRWSFRGVKSIYRIMIH